MDRRGFLVISPEDDNDILQYLPPDYIVLDYIYVLEGPPLFTYHRDVTSSKTVFKTRHPTYTMIQYFYNGDFLSVSPRSHNAWAYNFPITLSGKSGTRILFDCDLVHGGVDAPEDEGRIAAQYKIIHKDDVVVLKHLEKVNVSKRGTSVSCFSQISMRIFSYLFAVPIQWIFLPLLHAQYTSGLYGFLQSLIPINHYNNYKSL